MARRRRGKVTSKYQTGFGNTSPTGVVVPQTSGLGAARPGFTPAAAPGYTPMPGAPPVSSAPPPDPWLEASRAQARTAVSLGNIWDTYATGNINADYGFNTAGGIDPNNPYSRTSLLQRSYEEGQRGTMDSLANAGQLYSGALGVAQSYNSRQYDIGLDQLRKGKRDALNEIVKGKVDRYSTYGANLDQASLDSLTRALGG